MDLGPSKQSRSSTLRLASCVALLAGCDASLTGYVSGKLPEEQTESDNRSSPVAPADGTPMSGEGSPSLDDGAVADDVADAAGSESEDDDLVPPAPPVFTSLAWTFSATDGYLNAAERSQTTALVGNLSAIGHASVSYRVVSDVTTCDGALTYDPQIPASNTVAIGADGDYKVCVKLTSAEGIRAYGETATILAVDATPPTVDVGSDVLGATTTVSKAATVAGAQSAVWSQEAGTMPVAIASPGSASTDIDANAGSYVLRLTATDAAGNTASDDFALTWQLGAFYWTLAPDPVTPTVNWNASTGADHYEIRVASDLACSNVLQSHQVPAGTLTKVLDPGLSPNQTHYVCMSAVDPDGGVRGTDFYWTNTGTLQLDITREGSWDTAAFPTSPTPRYFQNPQQTWTGTELLVWSGARFYGDWPLGDGMRYDPATDAWQPMSSVGAPEGRLDHTSVWVSNRLVTWGGMHYLTYNTGGIYDPAADTWTMTSMTDVPQARVGHVAVAAGAEMIVWGGASPDTDTGGRLDPITNTWTPTDTSDPDTPAPRFFHTGVWTGTELIIWGGEDTTPQRFGDGARYVPASDSWTAMSTAGAPTPRRHHAAVWTGTEMLVWGGYNGTSVLSDGARYNPGSNTWTPITNTGAPLARFNHSAVWTGTEMIVFGGQRVDGTSMAEGAAYDPVANTWRLLSTVNQPVQRFDHVAVWTGTRMLVTHGATVLFQSTGEAISDGGSYDPATDTWTELGATKTLSQRTFPSDCWTASNRWLVFGGLNSENLTRTTGGLFDPGAGTWSMMSTAGAPSPSTHAPMTVCAGSKFIVWGGRDPVSGLTRNTGAVYDMVGDTWTPTDTTDPDIALPSAQGLAAWTGTEMLVYGGCFAGSSGGRYNPTTNTWEPLASLNAPQGTCEANAVWTGTKWIWWGGNAVGDATPFNTGAVYDPVANTWTPMSTVGAPPARVRHGAVWIGDRMLVFGGTSNTTWGYKNDGYFYDPIADTWAPITLNHAPSPVVDPKLSWTGTEVLVTGGQRFGTFEHYQLGSRYNPATNQWTTMAHDDLMPSLHGAATVYGGGKLYVFGGRPSSIITLTNVWTTPAVYTP